MAEDNLINQKVAGSILKNMGIIPDIASNGIEAVEACKRKKYDIVLMDIQMPEMDGMEATRKILEHYAKIDKKPPVIIAMTANVLEESKNECRLAGMQDFISKPVTPKELENRLGQWIRSH